MVIDDILFHLFLTFNPIPHGPKIISLNKIHNETRKYSLSEENFNSIWINTLGKILLKNINDSTV